MFPIRDDNPQINRPIATYVLIGLNIFAWIFLQGMGGQQLNSSICQFGLIPADLFANASSQLDAARSCQITSGWFNIVTSMFMHANWMHLIGNMWFLFVFGDNIEDAMGSIRFAIFYLVIGILAALAQVLIDPNSTIPLVGASGAIGGVMGAYIMLYPRVKVHMLVFIFVIKIPAVAMLGYWLAVQIIGSINTFGMTGGGVAFAAHVGGFISGALLIRYLKDDELLVNHPYHGWKKREDPANIWQNPDNHQ